MSAYGFGKVRGEILGGDLGSFARARGNGGRGRDRPAGPGWKRRRGRAMRGEGDPRAEKKLGRASRMLGRGETGQLGLGCFGFVSLSLF